MRDISTIILASVFVLFSLIVLLSAASTPDYTSSTLDNDQQRVSDLGSSFRLQKISYTDISRHSKALVVTGLFFLARRTTGILAQENDR